ncbi:MAG: radical SAM protein [Deltaproteobacteria bacterium]|nr:radical SAM protein [Deltaproteobacteria bacterium]
MSLNAETACRVFDVQRFSIHDGPGIRTTVFLAGCPLRCAFCQNPESFRPDAADLMTPRAIIAEVLKDRDYYAVSGGGLTVSGGDPLLHVAPVRALLEEARRNDLHTCVQTSGAVPEANLAAVLGLVDLFQLDLKHMDARRHRALTGASNERVLRAAAFLAERGAAVQFRMPLLPGVNDDDENLGALARFLAGLSVHALELVPYHRLYLDKYASLGLEPRLRDLQPPSAADRERVVDRLRRHGVAARIEPL